MLSLLFPLSGRLCYHPSFLFKDRNLRLSLKAVKTSNYYRRREAVCFASKLVRVRQVLPSIGVPICTCSLSRLLSIEITATLGDNVIVSFRYNN